MSKINLSNVVHQIRKGIITVNDTVDNGIVKNIPLEFVKKGKSYKVTEVDFIEGKVHFEKNK